ncbi:MAG: YonK family protein [Lachnospiraceae bacterium]|nr:YonK family protein [Lachnospiraceae bacterium]
MATAVKSESFTNAVINAEDMTITEFSPDSMRTYSLIEFLRRWDGVPDVVLSISRSVPLPPDWRDDD